MTLLIVKSLCSGNNSHLFLGLFKPTQVISKNFPGIISAYNRYKANICERKEGRKKGRRKGGMLAR